MKLLTPIGLGSATAPNRVMFGPHVTNLGDDRALSARHVAYYERRARGGCGVIVVEEASVHPSDWPYERSPLASECAAGWTAIADACHAHGSLVIAAIGHTGGQGSSAYSQREMWAPSRVPEVNSREVPKWMEADDIADVIAGFAAAARLAVEAGCDGVEINAGQHSLVRQFLSGLTNQRDDEWAERSRFAREVIAAVRRAAPNAVVGLRLSCDELAPWAGVTPEQAPGVAAEITGTSVDYLVVTRGSIFTVEKTRGDFHEPTMVNVDVCRAVKAAVTVPVFLQGSVVESGAAEWAIDDGVCDAVEMTRAQIADATFVAKTRSGAAPRPCIRCNQTCQVRDARNPIVTCVGDPASGWETTDTVDDAITPTRARRAVMVIGAGPAGLEAARVAAMRGHDVRVVEREDRTGGLAAVAGPGQSLVAWLENECRTLGVTIDLGVSADQSDVKLADTTIVATGSIPGVRPFEVIDGAVVLDIAEVRRGVATLPDNGPVAIFDPIGGPIAVALAEELGDRAVLITHDNIAGNELSRTGDLAPANVRLAQRGVTIERRTLLRTARPGEVELEDRFTGVRRTVMAAALVDCGFRLPDPSFDGVGTHVGDRVAPRTLLEAVREGRAAALAVDTSR